MSTPAAASDPKTPLSREEELERWKAEKKRQKEMTKENKRPSAHRSSTPRSSVESGARSSKMSLSSNKDKGTDPKRNSKTPYYSTPRTSAGSNRTRSSGPQSENSMTNGVSKRRDAVESGGRQCPVAKQLMDRLTKPTESSRAHSKNRKQLPFKSLSVNRQLSEEDVRRVRSTSTRTTSTKTTNTASKQVNQEQQSESVHSQRQRKSKSCTNYGKNLDREANPRRREAAEDLPRTVTFAASTTPDNSSLRKYSKSPYIRTLTGDLDAMAGETPANEIDKEPVDPPRLFTQDIIGSGTPMPAAPAKSPFKSQHSPIRKDEVETEVLVLESDDDSPVGWVSSRRRARRRRTMLPTDTSLEVLGKEDDCVDELPSESINGKGKRSTSIGNHERSAFEKPNPSPKASSFQKPNDSSSTQLGNHKPADTLNERSPVGNSSAEDDEEIPFVVEQLNDSTILEPIPEKSSTSRDAASGFGVFAPEETRLFNESTSQLPADPTDQVARLTTENVATREQLERMRTTYGKPPVEKQAATKKLERSQALYEERFTPFRECFEELRKLRNEQKLMKTREQQLEEVVAQQKEMQEKMMTNLRSAVAKVTELKSQLEVSQSQLEVSENRCTKLKEQLQQLRGEQISTFRL